MKSKCTGTADFEDGLECRMNVMRSSSLLVLVVIAAALVLTNPTTDEYSVWVREEVQRSQPVGDRAMLSDLFTLFGGPLVNAATTRNDYFVFSIFTTTLDANNRVVVLGALRHFIPLQPVKR